MQELSEHVEKLEEDQKHYQDALSYKDNEIDVLKECFVQLKALEAVTDKDSMVKEDAGDSETNKCKPLSVLYYNHSVKQHL